MPRKTTSARKNYDEPIITQPETKNAPACVSARETGNPPALFFCCGGWCEALHDSYMPGYYQPKSWREYDALKPFAKEG
ncbi:MAG: hypothetical protein J5654_09665 [Victivallales bacterium]|nr:hypothetical protein [Victivallales bacterium]